MGEEIERKFVLSGDGWRDRASRCRSIEQAYLASGENATVRVRIVDDCSAVLTIKSGSGRTRAEYEYAIPLDDACELMALARAHSLAKMRYDVPEADGRTWEVDEFEGALSGLLLAEIELDSEDENFDRPDWLGEEVTGDARYTNAVLAERGLPD